MTQAFIDAYNNLTKPIEGGWARVPGDPGGDTYAGFTRRDYGHLPFWAFLDTQEYVYNKTFPELTQQVMEAYYTEIWVKQLRGDEINDHSFSAMIFDMGVNKGMPIAIEFAQKAAGQPITGYLDDATINGLNNPTV